MEHPFVLCDADHPGVHRETGHCVAPVREQLGDRLVRWLDSKLNSGRVGIGSECPWCGNELITRAGRCAYCEADQ